MLAHLYQDRTWHDGLLKPGESAVHFDAGAGHVMAVRKRMRFTPFDYLRVTFGPAAKMATADERAAVFETLQTMARKHSAVYLEFNPYTWDTDAEVWTQELEAAGFRRAADHVYRNSIVVDLSQTEEEIFRQIERRGQKAIRQAADRGIEIRKVPLTQENIRTMYKLYCNTCSRTQFIPEDGGLLEKQLLHFGAQEKAYLFFAYYVDSVVGALVVFNNGESVSTIYQGNDYTEDIINRRPSNALYWESLKWARANGFRYYDFGGVTLPGATEDPKKAGIYNFKSQFGGQIVTLPGNHVYVNRPFIYRLVNAILPLYSKIALRRAKKKAYAAG
jgi:lipid II:glycine glycyltransferase (peptidoglycan interpeptide bridge formation enzyme)